MMTSVLVELYDALISAGVCETKAKEAAAAVPHGTELCTKQDLAEVRAELAGAKAELRAELKVLKFAVFSMYPFILAMVVQLFFLN